MFEISCRSSFLIRRSWIAQDDTFASHIEDILKRSFQVVHTGTYLHRCHFNVWVGRAFKLFGCKMKLEEL